MRRKFAVFSLILFLAACASAYRAASVTANAHAREYALARDAVKALHETGGVTAEQWVRWQTIRADVQRLGLEHDQVIRAWRDSGIKPAGYDTVAENLRIAEQKMIDLKREVLP